MNIDDVIHNSSPTREMFIEIASEGGINILTKEYIERLERDEVIVDSSR